MRLITALVIVALALTGCATFHKEPVAIEMKAELETAMARVEASGLYTHWCIWGGSCVVKPAPVVFDSSDLPLAAVYAYDRGIVINMRAIRSYSATERLAVMAHEMGHWALFHTYRTCDRDRPACEIAADAASVDMLVIGWGQEREAAVELVHLRLAHHAIRYRNVDTSKYGHDTRRELLAFRARFGCTGRKTCYGA